MNTQCKQLETLLLPACALAAYDRWTGWFPFNFPRSCIEYLY
jgi:hypothetical protein